MFSSNKRIAINTGIIYLRMAAIVIIGLFTTRYVLQVLGVSDYGLYNVVAGLITMLNVISIAMHTTTRRYINIEMGKESGDLNKIFNICFLLHLLLGVLIWILAETIGLFYINNYLNIAPEKISDAIFIFHISTLVAVIGIINIPYQGLLEANEKFGLIALIDLSSTLLKIPLVILLINYEGNSLRFYSIGICAMSLFSLILYQYYSNKLYPNITKFKYIWDKQMYKEILIFNNYTAIGAAVYLARSQGSNILVNFFFGTIINGAFAIAYQIEQFIIMFVNNLGTASAPQITQNYSKGDISAAINLTEKVTKYSIIIMLALIFPISLELEFILELWLGKIPEGTLLFCYCILISLFIRSLDSSVSTITQATGRIKWFTIISGILGLICLPIVYILFRIGFHPCTIIIAYIISDFIIKVINFILLKYILNFNFYHFFKMVYIPIIKILFLLCIYSYVCKNLNYDTWYMHILNLFFSFLYFLVISYRFGLKRTEKQFIKNKLINRL